MILSSLYDITLPLFPEPFILVYYFFFFLTIRKLTDTLEASSSVYYFQALEKSAAYCNSSLPTLSFLWILPAFYFVIVFCMGFFFLLFLLQHFSCIFSWVFFLLYFILDNDHLHPRQALVIPAWSRYPLCSHT